MTMDISHRSSSDYAHLRYTSEKEEALEALRGKLKKKKADLERDQETYFQEAERRHYVANTVSCACFPCTYALVLLNCAVCCPCNYYAYIRCKPTLLEKMTVSLNWCRDTPPKNRKELYCNYLSPCCCYDFPDPKQSKGRDLYFLPSERETESKRFDEMLNLAISIDELKKIILEETLKGTSGALPIREQMK
jgi:hypothetical protein